MFPLPSLLRLRRTAEPIPGRLDRLVWRALACVLVGLFSAQHARAAPTINVLLAAPAGIYQDAADSLSQALTRDGWKVAVSVAGRPTGNAGEMTVAIGTKALEVALAQRGRPVLSLLVPRLTYEQLAAGQNQVSALYLDQPLTRQLQLLRQALPGLKKVGVPLGPTTRVLQSELQNAAHDSGVQVESIVITQGADLFGALTELAEDCQALVLLPDPLVLQRGMLQNFFLHTYRLKNPVLAYSAPLATSGALLALYATPAQLGDDAASWIGESWSRGAFRLGPPRYPKHFSISVNRTVARSLGIDLPSEETLVRQLEAMP